MKLRIIAGVILVLLLSAGINCKANATPYRHSHGWCGPRPFVRVYVPPVMIGGYYDGGYYKPHHYCAPRYYGYRHYGGNRHYR